MWPAPESSRVTVRSPNTQLTSGGCSLVQCRRNASRREYLSARRPACPKRESLAEDLGMITPDVTALRDRHRLPTTRVLQFGFDGDSGNPHLPHNFAHNTIAYTGTHDNNTTRGWFEAAPDDERQRLW